MTRETSVSLVICPHAVSSPRALPLKGSIMRFRHVYMGGFSALILIGLFVSSPDAGIIQDLPFGAGFIATILLMLKAVIFVSLLHFSRKALFDYVDLAEYFNQAKTTPEGAGQALISVALAMVAIAILIYASVL